MSGRVGESPRRPDGPSKVRGEFVYSSDLTVEGMLWGATVRSPHPYARIISIDSTAALALPGVHTVLTHEDVPGRNLESPAGTDGETAGDRGAPAGGVRAKLRGADPAGRL